VSDNPRHSSDSNEHYTPAFIVGCAHRVMGGIDLDPASCEFANRIVQATKIYREEHDGYTRMWNGRVFVNPPGGQSDDMQRPVLPNCNVTGKCGLAPGHMHRQTESNQKKWWFKLADEFRQLHVTEAVFVCFSIELLQTTQTDTPAGLAIPLDFPIAYPAKRIAYDKRNWQGERVSGKSPPHASCIVYLGPNREKFVQEFSRYGRVK
jgi:hypothetical protein